MNTFQLECFVQVASNLSFRRAADELHVSQPTVSKQVASLEEELGGELFVRTTRSVMLTVLGESFLPDAREMLRLAYSSAARARRQASGVTLVIGYSDPNELALLALVLDSLRGETKGLGVSLRLSSRDDNVDQLSRARVDAALGFESQALVKGGVAFTLLWTDTLRCVVRAGSELARAAEAGGGSVGPEDVEGRPQVVCMPTSLHRHGYAARRDIPETEESLVTRCVTVSEALCLVQAGLGYALLPSVEVPPLEGLAALPWRGVTSARYGVYHRADEPKDLARRFVQVARLVYGKAGGHAGGRAGQAG